MNYFFKKGLTIYTVDASSAELATLRVRKVAGENPVFVGDIEDLRPLLFRPGGEKLRIVTEEEKGYQAELERGQKGRQ